MDIDPRLLERIHCLIPGTRIVSVTRNTDGLMNDVLIVNGERVFRFAKDEQWVRDCLQKEIRILNVVRGYVRMPVPPFDLQDDDFVSYRLLPGSGLTRSDIFRQPDRVQETLAQDLAIFLAELHHIPYEELSRNGIEPTNCVGPREEYLQLYEDLQREVLVYADSHVRRIVQEHFEPLLSGQLDINYIPCLVHGDLGARHILFDPRQGQLTGVIDWGIAGLSDPAFDYAVILNCYGEVFLHRMGEYDSQIVTYLERARFLSGISEASWILRWVRTKNPFWLTPGLGTARDSLPYGCKWT